MHVMPRRPARENVIFLDSHRFTLAASTEIVVPVRQQQHGVAGGMFQAKASALNGETKAAGVGKFGVFGFGVDVVVQLKLSGSEHCDVL